MEAICSSETSVPTGITWQHIPKDDILHWSYLSQAFPTPFPEIKFNPSSAKEIENLIKSLKPKNSNGYDNISVNILKISAPVIISPLVYICNRFL
jgi:hypothetical protein